MKIPVCIDVYQAVTQNYMLFGSLTELFDIMSSN